MKSYCHLCGTRLRLSKLRCPYCRQSSVSWLHVGVVTAFAVTAFVYLLKNF